MNDWKPEPLTKDGLFVVCAWCDHIVDEGRNHIRFLSPRHQMQLQVSHGICVECKARLDKEKSLYRHEITLSPLVAQRVMRGATV